MTHTGIRASYTFNDYVAATGGLNNGWDDPGNFNNGGPNYEGEIIVSTKDKSLLLTLNGIYGPNQVGHSNSNRGAIDPIVTFKPTFVPNLTLATEYLYASETGKFQTMGMVRPGRVSRSTSFTTGTHGNLRPAAKCSTTKTARAPVFIRRSGKSPRPLLTKCLTSQDC